MKNELFLKNGFELSAWESELFEKYLALFLEYNNHTNLSAIRDEVWIIEKHFIDSLYGANIIMNDLWWMIHAGTIRLLDIGSGWGFPGIPLKIVIPELDVTLLDSVGKKVKAMNHFVEELWLTNIYAIQERAEVLAKNPNHCGKYDFVVSRATAYITDILPWALPFLKTNGKVILYKMPAEDEMKDLRKVLKKFNLVLEGQFKYSLAEKDRVLYILSKKK